MKDTICKTCGHEIKGSGSQKSGRPRELHKECRELNNAISLLQNRMEVFRDMNPTPEKRKRLRSALWSLANSMN